ncbi:NAD-dependent epimerase/dehydratase family protein [Amycolatopsis umgeniensis]|uniref:dTDP-glucose 4,6-dehydratase n=1 Tax=Amycolatopsis umgeniensis TaxID=336628 RepID=A0A841BES2_9PSEU|nr:NAD-dependent epimerase/dehydratase family protein [Amycolatopsis umgeniensis]MBB5857500.1 dTDP-glucose 4,6-dehydratase [Amycolatopsis umgeniensis]
MIGSEGRPRRVLVAGGAGFIGGHLCARLLAAGHTVLCVDNLSTGRRRNLDVLTETERFDFAEADIVDGLVVSGPFDAIVNLASPASPPDYLRAPIETLRTGSAGTLALLELARAKGARLVHASTSEVYGDPLVHPQTEDYWGNVNPIGPRAVYDESKRFGEAACAAFVREYGTNCGIVRIFNTYGPGMRSDDGRLVPNMIMQALAGEPLTIHGSGEQTRSLCYVEDTVDALVRMIERDHRGPVNVGNPVELSVRRVAALVKELIGSASSLEFVPAMVDDPRQRRPVIDLAARELGWTPRTELREGLRRTIAFFAGEREALRS